VGGQRLYTMTSLPSSQAPNLHTQYHELRAGCIKLIEKLRRSRKDTQAREEEIIALRRTINRQSIRIQGLKTELEDAADDAMIVAANTPGPHLTLHTITAEGVYLFQIIEDEEDMEDSGIGSSQ
jgi:hypothetical protein